MRDGQPTVLPGFGLTLGFTTFFLSAVVLLPLAALVLLAASTPLHQLLDAVASPRALALSRPRARSPSSVSRPSPVASGAAASMRSISSPHPLPMSSTVRGLFRVSRATSRAALASDKGP